jgi:predicted peptidase
VYGTLASPSTGLTHNWIVVYPPGSSVKAKLPVVIVLHGAGDTFDALNHLDYHVHLGEAVRAGVRPFALAAIDGGLLFWQKLNGQDAGALVATDFLGLLAARGLDTSRLALTGWSMGGWGTLRLAGNELAGKLRAIAPISTPLYPDAAAAPERWMTDAEFAANNPYTHPQWAAGLPLWLACGTSDQFYPGNVSFTAILGRTPGVLPPQTHFTAGGHDFTFWESIAADQFRFLGEHL